MSATNTPTTFRAWVLQRYGGVDGLTFQQVPVPPFRDDHELLVRVRASSVNPADRHRLKPPFFLRRGQGFLRPKSGRLGADLAGTIVLAGAGVQGFQVGDEVFGVGRGAFGEFAIADHTEIAVKPPSLSFEQGATLGIAASTALQGLRDKAGVHPGQKVLVNGASGGVGTFAVQIARALGAEVSAVCSPGNVEQARALGAVRVFDYTREDFTASGERYHVIVDTQVNHPLSGYRRSLVEGGLLLMIGAGSGSAGRILGRLLKATAGARLLGPRSKFFVARIRRPDLEFLAGLVASGQVTPAIDRSYPLAEIPDALRYLIAGHARGKIVVTV